MDKLDTSLYVHRVAAHKVKPLYRKEYRSFCAKLYCEKCLFMYGKDSVQFKLAYQLAYVRWYALKFPTFA